MLRARSWSPACLSRVTGSSEELHLPRLHDALVEAYAFDLEQPLLAFDAAAVAAKMVPGLDDAMARDNDRDRIDVIGLAHRAHRPRRVDLLGHASVGAHLAPGDFAKRVPDAKLKVRPSQIERNLGEVLGLSVEVAAQGLGVNGMNEKK